MKGKRYYHVVTERPMVLNQVIIFDESNTNGVGNRVQKVEGLSNNSIENELDEMDKIILKDMARWSQISKREIALEEVRKKHYGTYPSRMASLYVSTSLDDAKKWAEYFISVGRNTYQIVELESSGNSFTGDAKNCWYESPSKEDSIIKANHYWQNKSNIHDEEPIYETIIENCIYFFDISCSSGWM